MCVLLTPLFTAAVVNQTTYEPCFEVGALLKGQVIDEIYDYNYQLDCQGIYNVGFYTMYQKE